jgi:hypothetical protein
VTPLSTSEMEAAIWWRAEVLSDLKAVLQRQPELLMKRLKQMRGCARKENESGTSYQKIRLIKRRKLPPVRWPNSHWYCHTGVCMNINTAALRPSQIGWDGVRDLLRNQWTRHHTTRPTPACAIQADRLDGSSDSVTDKLQGLVRCSFDFSNTMNTTRVVTGEHVGIGDSTSK